MAKKTNLILKQIIKWHQAKIESLTGYHGKIEKSFGKGSIMKMGDDSC